MRTRLGIGVAALVAALLGAVGLASPASAHTATIINSQTQLCLDSDTGGRAYTLRCNGGGFGRSSG